MHQIIKEGVTPLLVLTFQKSSVAKSISEGIYHVELNKSPFAFSSLRFTMGYKRVLKALKEKINILPDEGCIWGWVSSPSAEMVKNYLRKGYVAMYIDVNPEKCVLSDYEKFTDYVVGDTQDNDFIKEDIKDNKHCVQCSFTVDSILGIRAVCDTDFIILYNSIQRSLYATMAVSGIVNIGNEINSLIFNMKYWYNKTTYILNDICKEERVASG